MNFVLDVGSLAVAGALALRFSILAATMPFLGHRSFPIVWKLALALVTASAVAPAVLETTDLSRLELGWSTLMAEGSRSLLIGALLSFVVGIPFAAVRFAGQVTGIQIGFAIVNTIDPQSGGQVSVLANVYYLISVILFFAVDGHHTVLAALVDSCRVLPLFGPLDGTVGAWKVVQDFGALFTVGLRIAAPCLIVLLLVSTTMGIIVKTVPHINVLVVGFPIRIAVGVLVLGLSLTYMKEIFLGLLDQMGRHCAEVLAALSMTAA